MGNLLLQEVFFWTARMQKIFQILIIFCMAIIWIVEICLEIWIYIKRRHFFKNTGTLLLPDRVYRLKVAAVLIAGVSDDHIFQLRNWPKTWKEGQLDYIRSHALFAREDVLDDLEKCEHPQVVALTTCTSEFTDARTVVLAQMIPEKDADREE